MNKNLHIRILFGLLVLAIFMFGFPRSSKLLAAPKSNLPKQEDKDPSEAQNPTSQCQQNLIRDLPLYMSRSSSSWPEVMPTCEFKDSNAWTRVQKAVQTTDWKFSPPIPSADAHGGPSDGLRTFKIGDGLLSFTTGNPEKNLMPRHIYWGTEQEEIQDLPFPITSCDQVEAMWCAGEYLILALQYASGDMGSAAVNLTFWNLMRGKVSVFSMPGDDIQNFLPDWDKAEVAQSGGVVAFKSTTHELVFWPSSKEWAPFNKKTGKPIPDPAKIIERIRPRKNNFLPEEIGKSLPTIVGPTMRFDEKSEYFYEAPGDQPEGETVPLNPGEVVLQRDGKPEAFYCFCVHKSELGKNDLSTLGCFLLAEEKPISLITLEIRAAHTLEYAYCLRATEDNEVVIRTVDDTHGNGLEQYYYKVDPRGNRVTKIGKTEERERYPTFP